MTNLNLAFDVAEKHLDIPKMLDAEGKCLHVCTYIHVSVPVHVKEDAYGHATEVQNYWEEALCTREKYIYCLCSNFGNEL